MGWRDAPEVKSDGGSPKWASAPEVDAAVEDERPSAFTRNAAQVLPAGFGNQLMAMEKVAKTRLGKGASALLSGDGLGAAADAVTAPGAVEEYRQTRDELVGEQERASEEDPAGAFAGKVAGALPSALIPGAGMANAVKTGAVLGGAQGLAESRSDLTKGEVGGAAADTLIGGGIGAAAGALGHGVSSLVGKALGKVAGRANRGVAEAEAARQANAAAKVAKGEASALGQYRSAVQSASRDLEVLGREAGELPEGGVQKAAQEFIESPKGLAVREQVAGNKLGTAPERIAEMDAAKAAYQDLVSKRQALIDALLESDTVGAALKPRMATLGHRLVPAALAGVGGVIGGPAGAGVGAALGGVYALLGGRPGVILRNIARSPAARKAAWEFVQRVVTVAPESLGRFGGAISSALRQGGAELAEALHERALESDPAYQSGLLKALEEPAQ